MTIVDWLIGEPLDPTAACTEPLPTVPGFPFLHPGKSALISGPTGGGRSSLAQAGLYQAATAGLRGAYVGNEVTRQEFNARGARLAALYGDAVDDGLRTALANIRYLDLGSVLAYAWTEPGRWTGGVTDAYDVVVIDPLSSVAAALGLNFDQNGADYIEFYDRLVQPVLTAGVPIVLLDNIGHSQEARGRAKGTSAKLDRADLVFACRKVSTGLAIRATKVRTVRAAFGVGHEWIFERDTQRIIDRSAGGTAAPDLRPSTDLMERVSKYVEANPDQGKNDIVTRLGGNRAAVIAAIDRLVEEGWIRREQGPNRSQKHHSHRPYREDDDPMLGHVCEELDEIAA